ncbi:MAG: glycosyltransferase family 1 protein [bacterium]|nr:glycosyltransferase family 1 protein [bacterium]
MKTIGLITNAGKNSGVGSRAFQLYRQIGKQEDIKLSLVMLDGNERILTTHPPTPSGPTSPKGYAGGTRGRGSLMRLPGILNAKSISWIRLAKHIPQFDIYDLSNQSLSFIAKKRHPSIVTVHDIVELTDPQDSGAQILNRYLLSGITHADRIVAVSEYAKKSIQEYFGIAQSAITVIPNGVNEGYFPIPNFASSIAFTQLKEEYKLGEKSPILLSVGSEHPRKNMQTTLHTVALLKKQFPEIVLLKVGDPGVLSGRKKTLEFIDELGLQSNIKFLGNISEERLNELYNIADALLFPSHNEGFGLPPLEAMAAGCVVLCSNTTSLPEVVGDAAIMHEADNADAFAQSVIDIMANKETRQALIKKGIERAKQFSWKESATKVLQLYRSI